MRLAEVLMAFEPLDAAPRPSRLRLSPPAAAVADEAEGDDVLFEDIVGLLCSYSFA